MNSAQESPELELSERLKDQAIEQSKQQEQRTASSSEALESPSSGQVSFRPRLGKLDEEAKARTYDLVIFGASGSVGKFVVEELALVVEKYYSNSSNNNKDNNDRPTQRDSSANKLDPEQVAHIHRRQSVPRSMSDGVRWAVAGRSAVSLNETLCKAELCTGIKDLSRRVPMILADLNHQRSLAEMCAKTSLVVNCTGPYSAGSESLVQACLTAHTHYIDLSHETTFIEHIRAQYADQARKSDVYIINGCGFQSMSAEMGLNYVKQVVDGQINEVKVISETSDSWALVKTRNRRPTRCGIITPGMWRSLLFEKARQISCSKANKNDEQQSGCKRPLLRKDTQMLVKDIVEFHNRNSLAWLQLIKGFGERGLLGYCLPTNSVTSDEAQLIRGEMANYEHRKPDLDSNNGWRPVRCTSFASFKSLSQAFFALMWLFIFNIMVKFSPVRIFMGWFPSIFSFGRVGTAGNHLDRASLSHIKFCQTFLVYGTPNSDDLIVEEGESTKPKRQEQLLVSRIVGPEPHHVTTATLAVQAALAVITEKDHLPQGGGIITPGVAFAETNIIHQLRKRYIKFEVMKKL